MAKVALLFLVVLIGGTAAASSGASIGGRVELRIYDPAMQSKWEVRIGDVVRSSAHAARNVGGSGGVLSFRLTAEGALKFHRLTRDLARRGARLRKPQPFVLTIDGRVRSRPVVDYRAYPNGLDGRQGLEIQGMPLATAQRLARRIRGT